jgi:hypothetical protein
MLRGQGRNVCWLHALVLPRDEAWLCVFAATDVEDVHDLNQLAEVTFDAVLEAQLVRPSRVPRAGPASTGRLRS